MNASPDKSCPFCLLPAARILTANDLAVSLEDAFAVSPGHTLIIPRRHVSSFFELRPDEVTAIMELVFLERKHIDRSRKPQGYNVGINIGVPAGQTVMHAHVHLIPRYSGDVEVPAGGVRHVIPGKGFYTLTQPLSDPE